MKIGEIRQNNKEQITRLIREQRVKLQGIAFGGAGSREKNVKLVKTIKKDIARMMTILNEQKEVVKK